jgi:hypothetical protein
MQGLAEEGLYGNMVIVQVDFGYANEGQRFFSASVGLR